MRRGLDPSAQRRHDGRGHLVLDREDVLELAVVALGPDVGIGFRVDQLHGDAHATGGFANAPFHHVIDPELARHRLHVHRFAFVHEHGIARDDD